DTESDTLSYTTLFRSRRVRNGRREEPDQNQTSRKKQMRWPSLPVVNSARNHPELDPLFPPRFCDKVSHPKHDRSTQRHGYETHRSEEHTSELQSRGQL